MNPDSRLPVILNRTQFSRAGKIIEAKIYCKPLTRDTSSSNSPILGLPPLQGARRVQSQQLGPSEARQYRLDTSYKSSLPSKSSTRKFHSLDLNKRRRKRIRGQNKRNSKRGFSSWLEDLNTRTPGGKVKKEVSNKPEGSSSMVPHYPAYDENGKDNYVQFIEKYIEKNQKDLRDKVAKMDLYDDNPTEEWSKGHGQRPDHRRLSKVSKQRTSIQLGELGEGVVLPELAPKQPSSGDKKHEKLKQQLKKITNFEGGGVDWSRVIETTINEKKNININRGKNNSRFDREPQNHSLSNMRPVSGFPKRPLSKLGGGKRKLQTRASFNNFEEGLNQRPRSRSRATSGNVFKSKSNNKHNASFVIKEEHSRTSIMAEPEKNRQSKKKNNRRKSKLSKKVNERRKMPRDLSGKWLRNKKHFHKIKSYYQKRLGIMQEHSVNEIIFGKKAAQARLIARRKLGAQTDKLVKKL